MTNSSSFPDKNWNDLFLSHDQQLDMDAFLQSDLFAVRRSFNMKVSIASVISGSISFIASMLLIIHILRSHECLSSTYHRLIFGLSAADIISSFCIALSSTMVPKEMRYLVPFASGNIATCDAQGFIMTFAIYTSVGYNCSVCLYYLAIITYNKKYDYIRRKLEPWFHVISILIPLVFSIILLATKTFNGSNGGACFGEPHYPPHCIGYGVGEIPEGYSIPCWRGGKYEDSHAELRTIALYVLFCWVLIIAPVIMLVTMVTMLRSVTKIENRMLNYGVGSLRFRTTLAAQTNKNPADQQEERGFTLKLKKLGKYFCLIAPGDAGQQTKHRFAICCFRCPCRMGDADFHDPERLLVRTTKSNQMTSQKRAVLHMAFGYAGAWLLVWTPYFVYFVTFMVTKSVVAPDTLVIFFTCSVPLQGFFNFVVFMAPKVRNTRSSGIWRRRTGDSSAKNNQNHHQHLTWCQAFYKAYMGRGGRRRLEDRIIRNNNGMERKSLRATVRMINGTFRTIIERIKSFAR